MEYGIILGMLILVGVILKMGLRVKFSSIKTVKEIGYDAKLNELTSQFPNNKEVCKKILDQLDNKDVIIEEKDGKELDASFYMVLSNKIIIADIKNTFTRIQTIAHECIHSIQDRKILLFNFFYSNVYLLYFLAICVLTILKIIKQPMLPLIFLLLMGIIYYIVRSILETEAMSKAPYVAKEYMQKSNLANQEEINIIMENYHKLNKIGIPLVNYQLILNVLIKTIVYCIIAMIIV